jgi:hypothetical protein
MHKDLSFFGSRSGIGSGIEGALRFLKHADIRQIPIRLAVVEAVADHEEILDLGAEERDVNLDLAP